MHHSHPIGIFDSGYGGLTVFRSIAQKLPQYDFCYLGDNARAPYGSRSFETVYQYTLQSVRWFFKQGCPLVILACNTASAKALRQIQQHDLPRIAPHNRVLGVIRPTAEVIGRYTETGHVGVLGTQGTIESGSYPIEISHFYPGLQVHQQACPMWVHLIENNLFDSPGADFFIRQYTEELLSQSAAIDTILLACTHYPIIEDRIRRYLPEGIRLVSQGDIVADSLADYLQRHPRLERRISKGGHISFYTTDVPADFNKQAACFFGAPVAATRVVLGKKLP